MMPFSGLFATISKYFILWIIGLISLYITSRLVAKAATKSIMEVMIEHRKEQSNEKEQRQSAQPSEQCIEKPNEEKQAKVAEVRQGYPAR